MTPVRLLAPAWRLWHTCCIEVLASAGCSAEKLYDSASHWSAAWRPRSRVQQENVMLTTLATTGLLAQALPGGLVGIAIIFFIIAILAYVLGARGVAGMSAGIGRTLLFVFLVLAIIFVIIGLINRGV